MFLCPPDRFLAKCRDIGRNGSVLLIPLLSEVGAHGETIDGIGVAPDDNLPLTAAALSAGHDPDIEKAISLLRS
jgi:hypothetical protein